MSPCPPGETDGLFSRMHIVVLLIICRSSFRATSSLSHRQPNLDSCLQNGILLWMQGFLLCSLSRLHPNRMDRLQNAPSCFDTVADRKKDHYEHTNQLPQLESMATKGLSIPENAFWLAWLHCRVFASLQTGIVTQDPRPCYLLRHEPRAGV